MAVLDAPGDLESWFTSLVSLAGESQPAKAPVVTALSPDHYGFLVLLLSQTFTDEEQALLRGAPVITGAAYERGERPSLRGQPQ